MTLGNIISEVIKKDLSGLNKNKLIYSETINDGKFEIRLTSLVHKEATIECSIPDKNSEEEKNYLRSYFLSMAFNAAVHGMKRMKHTKNKKKNL